MVGVGCLLANGLTNGECFESLCGGLPGEVSASFLWPQWVIILKMRPEPSHVQIKVLQPSLLGSSTE